MLHRTTRREGGSNPPSRTQTKRTPVFGPGFFFVTSPAEVFRAARTRAASVRNDGHRQAKVVPNRGDAVELPAVGGCPERRDLRQRVSLGDVARAIGRRSQTLLRQFLEVDG